MTETKKGFIQLHTSVLLAGFTGLFGRLITLNEVDIVWCRMLFTTSILVVFTGLPRVGEVVLAVVWMWRLAGLPLDFVLWFHQGLKCLHRCYLFLTDRFLYCHLRAPDIQET